MDRIIGILPVDGKSRSGNDFHFHEVSVLPSESDKRQVGQRSITYILFDDDDLANTIAFKLGESIKAGNASISAKKIKSHYSNGKRHLDYVELA